MEVVDEKDWEVMDEQVLFRIKQQPPEGWLVTTCAWLILIGIGEFTLNRQLSSIMNHHCQAAKSLLTFSFQTESLWLSLFITNKTH